MGTMNTPLPCDVLVCPRTKDVILIPTAFLAIRLTPEQQCALAAQMPALKKTTP